jgi:phage-related minor tail protein
MNEERKVQLTAEFDASGVKQGVGESKQAMRDLAQEAKNSGQAASQALDGIGASADKLTQAQQRVVESIKRQAIAATDGKTGLLEYKAAVAGVTDAASPYIARIKQAEQGQDSLGMSSKQLAFALRGIPAQFTDIAVSLQSGQRPLTVLLQQGGQLKDMFGGIGPAVRAMGGYLLSLVTPVTVAAAVIGTLAYAALQGAKELDEFQKQSILSGNAAGLSASNFTAMRDSLVGIAGTKGKAAAVLTEIAASGKFAGDNVRAIGEAAVLMERATGQAVSKTIEQFAELAKTPTDAAAKLNEQYNFLTAAVFKQIKALEDQGRTVDAATLAEKTYSEALKSRANDVVGSAGTIEKAWRGIVGVAKSAWDAMLGIGRELSPGEKLAQAAADVARIQGQLAGLGTFSTNAGGAAFGGGSTGGRRAQLQAELDQANAVLASARRRVEVEASNTEEKAKQNRLQQLGIEFAKQGDEFLTKQQQKQREITKAQTEGQQLVAAGIITQTELTQRLNLIRQKYNETTGQGEVAAIQARNREQQQYLERLNVQIAAGGAGADFTKLTDNEKLVIKLQQDLQTGLMGVARAQKEKALAAAQAGVQTDKDVTAAEKQLAAVKAERQEHEKQIATVGTEAARIRELAAGQEAANATFGRSKTAIEQMRLAEMQKQLAEADAFDTFDPKYVASLREKTAAQQEYVKALQDAEYKQANSGLDEAARVAQEQTASLSLELSLLGRTREERDKIVAIRRVEVALAKELADIDKRDLGTGPEADVRREELKAKARTNAVVEANNAAQKVVIDEWNRTSDQINQSLTDALLRGFESGKDFAQNFRDTLKNMFATLVLRPIIQGILAPVSGAISGVINGGIGSMGSSLLGSTAGSFLSNGATSLLGSGSILGNMFAGATGVGGSFASTVGAGLATDAMGATVAEGTAAATLGTASTLGATLMAAAPYIAIAAIAVGALMKKGGGPKVDGQYNPFTNDTMGVGNSANQSQSGVAAQAAQAIQTQYNTIISQLGGTASLKFGVGLSTDPQGTAPSMVQIAAGAGGVRQFESVNLNVGRGDQDLQNAIAAQSVDVLLQALRASNLDKPFADFFNSIADSATTAEKTAALKTAQDVATYTGSIRDLGGVFSQITQLSVDAREALIQAAGGIDALTQSTSAYYQNFYSDTEKRNIAAQQISRTLQGAGLDIGVDQVLNATRAQFRSLVDSLDVTTDAGRTAFAALMSVAGAFASITPAAQDATAAATSLAEATKNSQVTSDLDAASKALVAARQAEADAMKTSITTLQQSSTRLRTLAQDLRSFRDSLLFGALSPLTPQQKYEQARAQFDSTYAAALSGDQGAQGRIQEVSQQFLEASQVYNASSSQYLADFAKVQTALTIGAAKADEAAAWAEQQATLLQTQLDKLTSIDQGVLSVADAVKQLTQAVNEALAAGLNPGAANLSALTGGVTGQFVPTGVGAVYASSGGAAATGGTIYTIDGNAYTIDQARSYLMGLYQAGQYADGYYALKKAGVSLADGDTLMGWAPDTIEKWARDNGYPVFHAGTDYVPRTGLALLQQGEAVVPAAMNLGGANGVAALVERIDRLTARVEALQNKQVDGTKALISATYDAHERSAGAIVSGVGGAAARGAFEQDNARKAIPA